MSTWSVPEGAEIASNRWSGNTLLIAHRRRGLADDTLYADLTTFRVSWRFGKEVASCTSLAATVAAFRLIMGERR